MKTIYVENVFPQISKFLLEFFIHNPAGIYLFKVNKFKLTMKTSEWRRLPSGVFVINFEQISHIVLVFLLLTLNK